MKISQVKKGGLAKMGGKVHRIIDKHVKNLTVTGLDESSENPEPLTLPLDEVELVEGHPMDQINPQLAKDAVTKKQRDAGQSDEVIEAFLKDDAWIAEEKFDGERALLAFFDLDEPSSFLSIEETELHGDFLFRSTTRVVGKNSGRLGVNTHKLPHLGAALAPTLSGTTVFDGEIVHMGAETRDAQFRLCRSIMGSSTEKALELQRGEAGPVQLRIFDVLWMNGVDMREKTYAERRAALLEWYLDYGQAPCFDAAVEISMAAFDEASKRELLLQVLEAGGEGIMLKRLDAPYASTVVAGKRSKDLLKVKPFSETDAIILGFNYGEGMYNKDRYGAIRLGQYVHRDLVAENDEIAKKLFVEPHDILVLENDDHLLVEIGTCGGFTDEMEARFRDTPDEYIGLCVEVKYQDRWEETGFFRSPNFLRMRTDKSPMDCVFDPES